MLRTRLLSASRYLALALFLSVAAALAVYLLIKNKRADQQQQTPKLRGSVVAVFNNTRYAHEVHGQVRFILTSQTDKSYSDGTHELEGVSLESFGTDNNRHDFCTADRAKVSNPSDLDKLDAEFISNVVVKTSDGLTVKTEYLHYKQNSNTVETDKPVDFEGRNFSGKATGLFLEADTERVRLLQDVDVTIQEKASDKASDKPGDAAVAAAAGAASNAGASGADKGSRKKKAQRSPEERAAHKAEKRRQ